MPRSAHQRACACHLATANNRARTEGSAEGVRAGQSHFALFDGQIVRCEEGIRKIRSTVPQVVSTCEGDHVVGGPVTEIHAETVHVGWPMGVHVHSAHVVGAAHVDAQPRVVVEGHRLTEVHTETIEVHTETREVVQRLLCAEVAHRPREVAVGVEAAAQDEGSRSDLLPGLGADHLQAGQLAAGQEDGGDQGARDGELHRLDPLSDAGGVALEGLHAVVVDRASGSADDERSHKLLRDAADDRDLPDETLNRSAQAVAEDAHGVRVAATPGVGATSGLADHPLARPVAAVAAVGLQREAVAATGGATTLRAPTTPTVHGGASGDRAVAAVHAEREAVPTVARHLALVAPVPQAAEGCCAATLGSGAGAGGLAAVALGGSAAGGGGVPLPLPRAGLPLPLARVADEEGTRQRRTVGTKTKGHGGTPFKTGRQCRTRSVSHKVEGKHGGPPGGCVMLPTMKRLDGHKRTKNPDEGWVVVKVKLRPAIVQALQKEATRESQALHRRVYVSDLLRDAIRLLLQARRIDPYADERGVRRFIPSDRSE